MNTLRSPSVQAVLARIAATDAANRGPANERFRARRAAARAAVPAHETAEIYRDAPMAVAPEVGELLYVLTALRRPARGVEFGMSFGASTICIAAALRDAGGGSLVTTELDPQKARVGERNVAEAGLADLVEIRVGDALETLTDVSEPVDLLFLDGLNELYRPVLRLVEPRLSPGALVAADRSAKDPDWPRYSAYVRDPASGYVSVEVPVGAGVEVSVRTAA
jgi:predicted O-methyltransferase YrrM